MERARGVERARGGTDTYLVGPNDAVCPSPPSRVLVLPEPQGAFYAFPKFDDAIDSAAFTAELVRETGVALAPGVGFGRDGEGYVRVCFASSEATIADALERVKKFVTGRRA